MTTSKTLIFFGTDDFSAPSLTMLIENGYDIRAVVTKPDTKKGRGLKVSPSLVKEIATKHSIPVWQPEKLDDIADNIAAMGSVTGILVSYGKIISQHIIDLFTPGIINVHPSLLPHYRGSTPIESAIANGDTQMGISIMRLSAKMDAGPVYAYALLDLDGTETQADLYERAAHEGAQELRKVLPLILDGSCTVVDQDETQATYTQLLTKADSVLDEVHLTAEQCERKIRAHLVFPKTKITINDHLIIVTKAHVVHQAESILDITCKDSTFLHIDELVAPSGRTMSSAAFLNGYAAG
ncbi:MAG: fmt [Candidatus Saccharibacteria bacterium]|nr:fmt [Candidatus Saccharibacteria bacterium]